MRDIIIKSICFAVILSIFGCGLGGLNKKDKNFLNNQADKPLGELEGDQRKKAERLLIKIASKFDYERQIPSYDLRAAQGISSSLDSDNLPKLPDNKPDEDPENNNSKKNESKKADPKKDTSSFDEDQCEKSSSKIEKDIDNEKYSNEDIRLGLKKNRKEFVQIFADRGLSVVKTNKCLENLKSASRKARKNKASCDMKDDDRNQLRGDIAGIFDPNPEIFCAFLMVNFADYALGNKHDLGEPDSSKPKNKIKKSKKKKKNKKAKDKKDDDSDT